jgi:hypothetical protein
VVVGRHQERDFLRPPRAPASPPARCGMGRPPDIRLVEPQVDPLAVRAPGRHGSAALRHHRRRERSDCFVARLASIGRDERCEPVDPSLRWPEPVDQFDQQDVSATMPIRRNSLHPLSHTARLVLADSLQRRMTFPHTGPGYSAGVEVITSGESSSTRRGKGGWAESRQYRGAHLCVEAIRCSPGR